MLKKLSRLSFVIGLFFTIVAIILLINDLLNDTSTKLNLYTGGVFLVFGVFMMMVKERAE
ncbi:MAG: hypothetical protein H7Y31_16375 [Chitinophagaceae bacterium]|nr:hypothetical protein [Chitinophagaceae bacterium]